MWHRIKAITVIILIAVFSSSLLARNVMSLAEGEATNINVARDISSVFIANPNVADYQVIDKRKIVIFGKAVGETTVIIFDEQSNTLRSVQLVVNKSLVFIQQQIQLHYPDADVTVTNIGEQVVLHGTVASEKEKDEINILTGELLSKAFGDLNFEWSGEDDLEVEFMQRREFKGLVNNIEVATTKQVNVKLSIAEVSHTFLEDIGIEYSSLASSSGTFLKQLTNSFSASDILAVISAIDDDTVGQILAEPNLSVISGETASFLVGGEMPIVSYINDTTTVTYKEFGISLELMAKVLRDDKIMLSLMPEVSGLDTTYENEDYDIPALKTRRARTTVELGDGQSFVLAGLLSSEERESIRRLPFLGDIPFLGALFSHSTTERNKTELIIVATVNLVKPIHPSQVELPLIKQTETLERLFSLEPIREKGSAGAQYKEKTERWVDSVLATGGFKK